MQGLALLGQWKELGLGPESRDVIHLNWTISIITKNMYMELTNSLRSPELPAIPENMDCCRLDFQTNDRILMVYEQKYNQVFVICVHYDWLVMSQCPL